MKRINWPLLVAIIFIMTLLNPITALASDITGADFYGVVTVSNNGTATTYVSSNITNLHSDDMITLGYYNASANNTAMRDDAGNDVAFMPGYGSSASMIWAGDISGTAYESYVLYTKNATGGKIRFFPDNAGIGMTTADNATIELGTNFAFEQSGYYNTTSGASKYAVQKSGAFVVDSGSTTAGAVTSQFWNNTVLITQDTQDNFYGFNGANWIGQTYTAVDSFCSGVSLYLGENLDPTNTVTVSIYATTGGVPTGSPLASYTTTAFNPNAWNNCYFTNVAPTTIGVMYAIVISDPGDAGANYWFWYYKDTASVYSGGTTVTSNNSGSTWTADSTHDHEFKVYGGGRVSSSVASGEHDIATIYSANYLTNATFELGGYTNCVVNGNMATGNPPATWTYGTDGAGGSEAQVSTPTPPTGFTYAMALTTANTNRYANQSYNCAVGTTVTFGCWVYNAPGTFCLLYIFDNGGGFGSSSVACAVTGQWQWITVTRQMNDAGAPGVLVRLASGSDPGDVTYFTGAELLGTSAPTSWIGYLPGAGQYQKATYAPHLLGGYSTEIATVNGVTVSLYQSVTTTAGRNKEVTAGAWVWSSSPNTTFIQIQDSGVQFVSSPFHPGDSQWHFLSATLIGGAGATDHTIIITVNGSGGAGTSSYCDGAILVIDRAIPNLLMNGSMEAGDPPTGWTTLSASISKSFIQIKWGNYSMKIDTAGTGGNIYEAIGSCVAGQAYTGGAWIWASLPNVARFELGDTHGQTFSSYHTGDSTWQWLSATYTAVDTTLYPQACLELSTTTVYMDGAILVPGLEIPAFYRNYDPYLPANCQNLNIVVDDVISMWATIENSQGVFANSNNYASFQNNCMPYVEYQKIAINGIPRQYVSWEYATTFTDKTGNSQNATPAFEVDSTDADVHGEMSLFLPVTEARAPAYTLSGAPSFITTTPGMSGNFTVTVSPPFPGANIVTDMATASSTPAQLPFHIIAGFIILTLSVLVGWMMRQYGQASTFVKLFVVAVLMGIAVALKVYDVWMVLIYFFIGLAFAMGSKQPSWG